jgi:hypothetical protein
MNIFGSILNKLLGLPGINTTGLGVNRAVPNFGTSLPSMSPTSGNIQSVNAPGPSSIGPVTPSTGGQAPSGGGSYGSGLSLTPPSSQNPGPSQDDMLNILRGQFSNAQNDIRNQGGSLDSSYGQAKTDIGNTITDAQKQAEAQKTNNESTYGNLLKQSNQTYRELGQQRQGTFSALGTLDSSAYGDQQAKADQALADQTGQISLDKTKSNSGIDNTLTTFSNQANSQLATLANQYQQGKNAIASALASNNLQEASAIQDALTQIRQQAYQIQNNITNFANQAAMLKSQGYGVNQSIAGYNGNQFGQNVQSALQQAMSSGKSQYVIPSNTATGQGYIAPNGKYYSSYEQYLSSNPPINP